MDTDKHLSVDDIRSAGFDGTNDDDDGGGISSGDKDEEIHDENPTDDDDDHTRRCYPPTNCCDVLVNFINSVFKMMNRILNMLTPKDILKLSRTIISACIANRDSEKEGDSKDDSEDKYENGFFEKEENEREVEVEVFDIEERVR